jgi:hypothetical protein
MQLIVKPTDVSWVDVLRVLSFAHYSAGLVSVVVGCLPFSRVVPRAQSGLFLPGRAPE